MTQAKGLDIGEAHLWVLLRKTPCGRGLRPRHPGGNQAKIGPTAFAVCYGSLRTPSQRPTACGGQRTERIGRIALWACYPPLHTSFGLQPALGRLQW
jgi:hypothetical protein